MPTRRSRSARCCPGTARSCSRAGVVADSDPTYEYNANEAKNKAMAVLNAIAAAGTMRRVGDIS